MAEERITEGLTTRFEKRILRWLCERMPQWMTSDILTGIGFLGGFITLVCYALSNFYPALLILGCVGLVINWFGDSLDGTLARYRRAERPKFGFFIDRVVDGLVMGMVALGAGLSPFVGMVSSLTVLITYLLMTIVTLAESKVTGVFRLSYHGMGPTEVRGVIIVLTLAAYFFPVPSWQINGSVLTIYDFVLYAAAGSLFVAGVSHAANTARKLAELEPPRQ